MFVENPAWWKPKETPLRAIDGVQSLLHRSNKTSHRGHLSWRLDWSPFVILVVLVTELMKMISETWSTACFIKGNKLELASLLSRSNLVFGFDLCLRTFTSLAKCFTARRDVPDHTLERPVELARGLSG